MHGVEQRAVASHQRSRDFPAVCQNDAIVAEAVERRLSGAPQRQLLPDHDLQTTIFVAPDHLLM
jgi:hypothetical protein